MGFSPMKFSRKYFHGALASGVYYLNLALAKYSQENFNGILKNHKSLAQQITVSRKIQLATCFPWQPLMPTPPDNDLIFEHFSRGQRCIHSLLNNQ